MVTSIHSSRSCLPPFYTIPIFPLLNERFFIYLSPFFFCCTLHIKFYALWNIIISCGYLLLFSHLLCLCRNCVMYIGIFHFKERLPEAICCCLQTCNVDVVLVVLYCMYIPAFIVSSADISQLWVYLSYLLLYCLRLFVVV